MADPISPLTGQRYHPYIQTDYSSGSSLVHQLTEKRITTIICTFIMDSESASASQIRLIHAADQSPCIRRFIPSEFNVEYDVPDSILPYPEKRFHLAARRELAKTRTTLDYVYIYPGMLMDYFGLPKVPSSLRPLCFFVDPAHGVAVLPGDGEARMSMTCTTDAAKYVALALELGPEEWTRGRVMTTAASTVSLNELVGMVEKALGTRLELRYGELGKWQRREMGDLPTNVNIAREWPERFPGGLEQLRGLIADLEAGVALGAFDLTRLSSHLDLVKVFEGRVPRPKSIEELVEEAWKDSGYPQ
jgi:hypothetical protein